MYLYYDMYYLNIFTSSFDFWVFNTDFSVNQSCYLHL